MKGGCCCESEIFSKTNLREVQGHQEKGTRQSNLRESQTQTETGLIHVGGAALFDITCFLFVVVRNAL